MRKTNTTKIIHGFRFLVILLTICDSVFSQQSNHHRRPFFDEGQLLIQGHTNDGFIDTLVTREIVKCLDAIRAEYPEVSEIKARHRYDLRTLMMELNDEANLILAKKIKPDTSAKLKNIPKRPYSRILGKTIEMPLGIEEIDELNEKYGASYCRSSIGIIESGGILRIIFEQPMDLKVLETIYTALPSVNHTFIGGSAGDGDDIFFIPNGDSLHFVFKHGWGDCPSGCIYNHFYYFTCIKGSNVIIKEGELPADKSRSGGIYRWGIPGRRAVKPFNSYKDIADKTDDPVWWISLHAVDVLGYLLSNPEIPRFGEDFPRKSQTGHFHKVRDDVLLNKKEAVCLLLRNIKHPHRQVSQMASLRLKELAKKEFGDDSEYIKKWENWKND